jgi:hypothetical protein
MSLHNCSEVRPMWIQEVINSYKTDQQAQELLAQLAVVSPNEQEYTLYQGIIKKAPDLGRGEFCSLHQVDTCFSFYYDCGSLRSPCHIHQTQESILLARYEGRCAKLCQTMLSLSID